jgi:hypothetical protein
MNRMDSIIKITSDARFRLARTLMTSGGGGGGTINSNSSSSDSLEGAIEIFASLLEECRNRHGETSLIAALCYYEYGNALFRAVVRRKPSLDIEEEKKNDHDDCEGDKKPAANCSIAQPIIANTIEFGNNLDFGLQEYTEIHGENSLNKVGGRLLLT